MGHLEYWLRYLANIILDLYSMNPSLNIAYRISFLALEFITRHENTIMCAMSDYVCCGIQLK